MNPYSLTHLSDETLDRQLVATAFRECDATAVVLARIAESDARKRFAAAGYPSMLAYCIATLPFTEEAARKRIHAARVAREFPAIFAMVADGRLSMSSVLILAPHLTAENADTLLAAAAGKSKAKLLGLLAERFPQPDLPTRITPLQGPLECIDSGNQCAPERVTTLVPPSPPPPPRVTPLAAERYALQLTIGRGPHDKLLRLRQLLGHQVPSGDLEQVLDRTFDIALRHLDPPKHGATKPRASRKPSTNRRYIPAEVKRAVHEREGGQCTFVSETGHRCQARTRLELDHILEVARGGESTAGNLRLRCRAHNQYTAEHTFGTEFMRHKRERARCAAASASVRAVAIDEVEERDVTPWLRSLGFRADETRRAATFCETIPDAPLEERIRAALSLLGRSRRRVASHSAAPVPR